MKPTAPIADAAGVTEIKAKLDRFRRKFYLNRILRGSIILLLLSASLFVLFASSEGFLWLSTHTRTVLMALLGVSALAVLGVMVLYPTLKYLRLSKTIDDEEAARLIGKHFPDVDDKLLNLLQLNRLQQPDDSKAGAAGSPDLLLAAIETRTAELRPVPFTRAVSFKPNQKLARWLLVPVVTALLLFILNPDVITRGSYRLVNFGKHFPPPPPFTILVEGKAERLVHGQTHTITIKVDGKEIPAELFMFSKSSQSGDYQKFMLQRESATSYSYTFRNVQSDFDFYIGNDLHGSEEYHVKVLERPSIADFTVVLYPPAYTRLPAETLDVNVGDFTAVLGTTAVWNFNYKGPVGQAQFVLDSSQVTIKPSESGMAGMVTRAVTTSFNYTVRLTSPDGVINADTVRYSVAVTPDKFPNVAVQAPGYETTLPASGIINLAATLSDDYGFTRAELHYRFLKSDNPTKIGEAYRTLALPALPAGNVLNYEQKVDFFNESINAEAGDQIEFYLKVWDNDGFSGPKAATSLVMKINYQSIDNLYEEVNKEGETVIEELQKMISSGNDLEKDFENIQKKLLEKKNLSYEDKKQLSKMIEKQQNLMKALDEAKQNLAQQIEKSDENDLFTRETLEKMRQLEKLMNETATDEFKKMLEQLQQKMNEMDNRALKQQMQNFEQQAERFKQDLERSLELLKQMKVTQKVEETLQKLENMRQRQMMLEEKTGEAKTKEQLDNIAQKQKELTQDMKQMDKQLQELKDLKKETRTPDEKEMKDILQKAQEVQDNMKQAEQEMKEAGQEMQQNKGKDAQKSKQGAQRNQQQAKDKIEQMQQELSKMQQDSDSEQQKENYEDLRALVENLNQLSKDQEDLRQFMTKLRANDPSMKIANTRQTKVQDDYQMIEDSLLALSKRAIEIEKFVTDELSDIRVSIKGVMERLNEKQYQLASADQTRIMTGLNNLANMLTESLDKMQQQMKMDPKNGKGKSCSMPKSKGGHSMKDLSNMQQQLNKQLQEMMEKMGEGKPNMEKLSEMAAQQESIRKKLADAFAKLQEERGKNGGLGSKSLLDQLAKDMKDTEEELKKSQLTAEMIRRQQQILSRMLDFDKSMREREFDDKRRSVTGKDQKRESPAELGKEELQQRIRREQFSRDKYRYTPLYQNIIDEYYKQIENTK